MPMGRVIWALVTLLLSSGAAARNRPISRDLRTAVKKSIIKDYRSQRPGLRLGMSDVTIGGRRDSQIPGNVAFKYRIPKANEGGIAFGVEGVQTSNSGKSVATFRLRLWDRGRLRAPSPFKFPGPREPVSRPLRLAIKKEVLESRWFKNQSLDLKDVTIHGRAPSGDDPSRQGFYVKINGKVNEYCTVWGTVKDGQFTLTSAGDFGRLRHLLR